MNVLLTHHLATGVYVIHHLKSLSLLPRVPGWRPLLEPSSQVSLAAPQESKTPSENRYSVFCCCWSWTTASNVLPWFRFRWFPWIKFSSSLQWPSLEHIQGLGKWRALTNSHHLHLSPEPHLLPAWFVNFLALFSYHLSPCLISASLILAFYPLGHLWWRSFLVSLGTVVLLSWCYLISRDLAMVYPVTYARDSCIQCCQSLSIDCSGSQSRLA